MAHGTCEKCGRTGDGRRYDFYFGFCTRVDTGLETFEYYQFVGKDGAFICNKCNQINWGIALILLGGALACGAAGWAVWQFQIGYLYILGIVGPLVAIALFGGVVVGLWSHSEDGSQEAIETRRTFLEPRIKEVRRVEEAKPNSQRRHPSSLNSRFRVEDIFLTPREYSKLKRRQR